MLKKIPLKSLIPVYKCSIQFNPLYKSLSTFIQSEAFSTFNKYQNDPNIPSSLKASDFLVQRHIGPSEQEISEMLKNLSVSSLDELMTQVIPSDVYDPKAFFKDDIKFPEPLTEFQYFNYFRKIAEQNQLKKNYIGCGYYGTIVPAIIIRSVIENPVWYTPYTPYQGEISQGRLECLLYFQTMISELTGLPFSNCSLLDEGTAAAEAMFMTYNIANFKKNKFFISKTVFPQTIDVVRTRAKYMNIEIIIDDPKTYDFQKHGEELCGALFQNPDNYGLLFDYSQITQTLKKHKCTVILAQDLLALTLCKTPGEMGVDIAIGSAQRFGVPLGYGGPSAAYFATTDEHKRKIPGRIIGVSQDKHKNKVYRMAMQTREQHIRREKATSNICTSQALLANCSALYGIYHGPKGLKNIGERVNKLTQILAYNMNQFGYSLKEYDPKNCHFFDTICVNLPQNNADQVLSEFLKSDINLRKINDSTISLSLDETTSLEDVSELVSIFAKLQKATINTENLFHKNSYSFQNFPENLQRKSGFMSQQIFNSIHSETQMLRFIRNISKKDISLAKSMIPLGSCTMKLNASSEMSALTWPHISKLHPFVPLDQAKGYQIIINELQEWLKSVTKFDAITFQPNSGAQGEYTGLLTINRYFEHRNEKHRNVCLVPVSAHGTNPASAAMAGMKVVAVSVDPQGNINLKDLKEKAEKHKDNLSTFMVTYPSTHGIFEDTIRESINIIHQYGGQVYMDGANMNAQVGLTSPGFLDADVCHLNLHKTFCIPHGGGGPGMGPIGVKKHLAPFLPGHSLVKCGGEHSFGSVSSAPWSSASLLTIPYSYIVQMGMSGLRKATQVAILNANYLETKLKDKYKVLYRGKQGRVAHEFILDIRPIKQNVGISEEDIAKRLMDFGFHAPTMSFPVPGTLMIEPTESEDKAELDRFIDALLTIREEIEKVANGTYDKVDNPLKNSPHTYEHVISSGWNHKYSREEAAFPVPWIAARGKHWPSCGRIDNAFGDRNLICTCPDITEYL